MPLNDQSDRVELCSNLQLYKYHWDSPFVGVVHWCNGKCLGGWVLHGTVDIC